MLSSSQLFNVYKKQINKKLKLGVVVHTFTPALWRLGQEDCDFNASLNHITRTHLVSPNIVLDAEGLG